MGGGGGPSNGGEKKILAATILPRMGKKKFFFLIFPPKIAYNQRALNKKPVEGRARGTNFDDTFRSRWKFVPLHPPKVSCPLPADSYPATPPPPPQYIRTLAQTDRVYYRLKNPTSREVGKT